MLVGAFQGQICSFIGTVWCVQTVLSVQITFCKNLMTSMTSGELARNVLEAEEQLEMHQERKAEIDGRHEYYLQLRRRGEELVEQKHYASEEIQVRSSVFVFFSRSGANSDAFRRPHLVRWIPFQTTLTQLDDVWYHLNETWEDRKQLLTQCYDLQVYEEYAEQADAWLSSKEGFLANEDLGVSRLLFVSA